MTRFRITLCGLLLSVLTAYAIPQQINYQGSLTGSSGTPLDTTVSITFNIWPVPAGGSPDWTETHPSVTVSDGLFHVLLGSVSPPLPDLFSTDRWLGIAIGGDSEMSPRQQIVSVAHAYRVGTVDGASGGTITSDVSIHSKLNVGGSNTNAGNYANVLGASNAASGDYSFVGGISNQATNISSVVCGGYLNRAAGGHAAVVGGQENNAVGNFSSVGGGYQDSALADFAVVSGGFGNNASSAQAAVGGGGNNTASGIGATVCGGYANAASGHYSSVAGGANNYARALNSFIGGGGSTTLADSNSARGNYSAIGSGLQNSTTNSYAFVGSGLHNIASGNSSFIGSGQQNTASNSYAVIGGGYFNTASGDYSTVGGGAVNTASNDNATVSGGINNSASALYATVSGGFGNTASSSHATVGGGVNNDASNDHATVGGGDNNQASGIYSTVGGGSGNIASGQLSCVPGGLTNLAAGNYSFAAGRRAKANFNGSFVWADQTNADFADSAANQFRVRASGGARIYSNAGLTAGVTLAAGGNAWVGVSDSTRKRNIHLSDTKHVLEQFAALPIKNWEYKSEAEGTEHIGPMAQDFWKAFHLGSDSLGIATNDADGVLFAAVQELAKQNAELKKELNELRLQVQAQAAGQQRAMREEQ